MYFILEPPEATCVGRQTCPFAKRILTYTKKLEKNLQKKMIFYFYVIFYARQSQFEYLNNIIQYNSCSASTVESKSDLIELLTAFTIKGRGVQV